MSSFTGKFREYPSISADNFEKGNLDSVAFFLSHCHKDHMSGLDSSAFHRRLMTSKTVFVYCSETTQNLLMCNPSYSHLKDYIRSIPLEQQTMIPLCDEKTEEQHSICVTLLPAGHCVGSVMFLFEGQHGNVLYTGDFRLAKGDVKRIPFFHANGRIKDIKSVYVDTTFCLPKMKSLPSREQSRDAIIELVDIWFSRGPEYVVSLLCKGMYGFEYLLKEVAMNYKTKIHVSSERLDMYRYLPDMTPYFTTDGRSTRIHACTWESKRQCESDLPCGLSLQPSLKLKVLRIKPTTMWIARDTEPIPADFKRYDKGKRLWRVVHSMHASMEEIQDLVGYLRPYHVFPNVPPAGLDTLENAFERLRGLTRLHECDSCNQDDSGEKCFKEQAACYNADKKKRTAPIKLLPVTRPVPDEKVLAQCKELGIAEEVSLAPISKRRKTKSANVVFEKETSIALQQPAETSSCNDRTDLQEVCSGTSVRSPNVAPVISSHTTPLSAFHDNFKHVCQVDNTVRSEKRERSSAQFREETTNTPRIPELRNSCPIKKCHAMSPTVLRDNVNARFDEGNRGNHTQFDNTETSTSRTGMREENENEIIYEVNNKQLKDTAQSRTKELVIECSRNSKKGVVEGKRNVLPKNNDTNCEINAIHNLDKREFGRSSRHSVEVTKQRTNLLNGSSIIDKNSATESPGVKENFIQGGVRRDFDVPPSPGHVEPCPDRLFLIHRLIQNGKPLPSQRW